MKPCLKCGCAKTPTNTSIDKRRNDGLCIYCKHCLKKQRNTPEAIKSRKEKEFVRRLAVDHCHSTGKIRGLLCHNCNTGLGKLGDSIESLTKALNYLKESK